jgi:hypothetical protein
MPFVLGTRPPRHKGEAPMTMIVLDPSEQRRLKRERALTGADCFDEVWDGVYMMSPLVNNEHQFLALELAHVIRAVVNVPRDGLVFAGCNVSDRETGWKKNYRCPDVAVFLTGNSAQDCGTHWFGGPDFAAEVVSPGDRSRDKPDFYAGVGVRELLIIDRKPWRLELYRLNPRMRRPTKASPKQPTLLRSAVLPLTFSIRGQKPKPRPEIVIATSAGGQTWLV